MEQKPNVSPRVITIGESLIDQVVQDDGSVINVVGGSPLNTALALCRQDIATSLVSRISLDELGAMISGVLDESNVDTSRVVYCDFPTTRAIATPDGRGGKKYEFDIDGTTQGTWDATNLKGIADDADYIVVTAALAAPIASMREAFDSFMQAEAHNSNRIFIVDPNIRPALIDDMSDVQGCLDRWISLSSVVKASAQDVEEAWSGHTQDEVARRWLDSGVAVVLITDGEKGAYGYSQNETIFVPAQAVDPSMGDTIGAGDTFTAGFIKFLIEHDLKTGEDIRSMTRETLQEAISAGTMLAAETCKRVGANPPWKPGLSPVEKVSV